MRSINRLYLYMSLLLLMHGIMATANAMSMKDFKKYPGWGNPVLDNSPMSNNVSSIMETKLNYYECVQSCLKNDFCYAVTYSRTTRRCSYQSQWFSFITREDDSDLIVLRNISVSYMAQSGLSSFGDAELLCSQSGQHVARAGQFIIMSLDNSPTPCECGYMYSEIFGSGFQSNPCTGTFCSDNTGVFCTTM